MSLFTVTINQWHIKHNLDCDKGMEKPVICVNHYEYCTVSQRAGMVHREWGPQIGETMHLWDMQIVEEVQVVYDPVNKTPCGASCWMEFEE